MYSNKKMRVGKYLNSLLHENARQFPDLGRTECGILKQGKSQVTKIASVTDHNSSLRRSQRVFNGRMLGHDKNIPVAYAVHLGHAEDFNVN